MKSHWVLALLLGALLLLSPAAASAQSTPDLSGHITDETGVLGGHEAAVQSAQARLLREHGVDLWVLFLPTTQGVDVTRLATEVAGANSLAASAALFLVALDDRTYAIWVGDSLIEITDSELDAILADDAAPRLRAGNHADAIVAVADGLGEALPGIRVTAPEVPTTDSEARPAVRGKPSFALPLGVVLLIAVCVLDRYFVRRRATAP